MQMIQEQEGQIIYIFVSLIFMQILIQLYSGFVKGGNMASKKLRRIKKYLNTLKRTSKDWHCDAIYKMRAYINFQTDTQTFIVNHKYYIAYIYKGKEIDRIGF